MLNNVIPSFYCKNEQIANIITRANIITSMDTEVKTLQNAIEDLLKQFFIDTTTWGLSDWERLLGLKIDTTETYQNRRARIKMAMRGAGTVTQEMLKNLCMSFTNGLVDVIENKDYTFIIKFIDVKGIPSNLEYLKQAIEEVKPAHLAYMFKYLYTICQNYIDWKTTCTEMLKLTCEEIKTYTKGDK